MQTLKFYLPKYYPRLDCILLCNITKKAASYHNSELDERLAYSTDYCIAKSVHPINDTELSNLSKCTHL